MINLLIIENDTEKCKEMLNCISEMSFGYKISKIAYTGKEAITLLNEYKIDIIIVDENLPDMSLLSFISMNRKKSNIPIIVLANSDEICISDVKNVKILYNLADYTPLINLLCYICNKVDEKIIINKIYEEFKKLQLYIYNCGAKYMAEAIYELYKRKDKLNVNMTQEVYPIIANKYGKLSNTIYSNIKSSYFGIQKDLLKDYIGCYDDEKVTLKELMYKVVENIS